MAAKKCCSAKLPKSIFGMLPKNQFLYLLLFVSTLMTVSADTELTCKNVKSYFERKGMLQLVDIQEQPNSDMGGACGVPGCCGGGARAPLAERARAQLAAALAGELAKLAAALDARARAFDESFLALVAGAREEFHAMFKRTYGMIYEQHSYVFEQLFEELQRYYHKGDLDFDQMMDGFFGILYQKMFTVLNSQYIFDDKYLKCVNEHMREIKPFEDVPAKLSVQLRRAFVATRAFRKALQAGAAAVRAVQQVGVTSECASAWARLRWCGACSPAGGAGGTGGAAGGAAGGGGPAPACSRYCHAELRACLAPHLALSDTWDAYVDAIEKVADRLLGPFNIAMVVEPIDIKISEAIMSFQEHNQEISQKIFAGCGKPDLGGSGGAGPFFAPDGAPRGRRAAPALDDDDFEIEASLESIPEEAAPPGAGAPDARAAAGLRLAAAEMAERARARARFLRYMRGQPERAPAGAGGARSRRAAAAAPAGKLDFRLDYEGKRGAKKKKPSSSKSDYVHSAGAGGAGERERGPAIDQLVRDTRARARSWRRYWGRLPTALCLPLSVTSAPCFNGSAVAPYVGSAELSPAVAVSALGGGAAGAGGAAEGAREALRALTVRLKDAYNGVEVQWRDDADAGADELQAASDAQGEWAREGSGSGSGDGDGDGGDDEGAGGAGGAGGGLPDDDEDRDYFPEGSGEREPDSIVPAAPSSEAPAPAPGVAPGVALAPPTNNVQLRGRVLEPPPPEEPAPAPPPRAPPAPAPAAAAARPSLQKALFMYALPVVCAWFGTIVTELF